MQLSLIEWIENQVYNCQTKTTKQVTTPQNQQLSQKGARKYHMTNETEELFKYLAGIISAQMKEIETLKDGIRRLVEKEYACRERCDKVNKDQESAGMDAFHEAAYGTPSYEEGGIADYAGSSSHINSAGEPDGWWK